MSIKSKTDEESTPPDYQLADSIANTMEVTSHQDDTVTAELLHLFLRRKGIATPELFHSQHEPYCKTRLSEADMTFSLRGSRAREFLQLLYFEEYGKAPAREAVQNAVDVLAAFAKYRGTEHVLSLRSAWLKGDLWIDLTDSTGEAVHITREGWRIETPQVPLFRRFDHQDPMTRPKSSSTERTPAELGHQLRCIFDIVNCPADYRDLWLVDLVCSLIPRIPRPVSVVYGPEGSAKTSMLEVMKAIIDPSERLSTMSLPRSTEEMIQVLDHSSFPVFDNVTGREDNGLDPWMADLLCRAVTGSGFSKRALYTNDEDYTYSFMRKIGLNGINNIATQPDLLRRSILYELPEIPEDKRLTREELWRRFHSMASDLLGAVFDVLSGALRALDLPSSNNGWSDMADFEKWGCAISQAMGLRPEAFVNEYRKNLRLHTSEALDNDLVASVLTTLLNDPLKTTKILKDGTETSEPRWTPDIYEGTPTQLLQDLEERARELSIDLKDKGWPKSPNGLGRRLRRLEVTLKKGGITVDLDARMGTQRLYKFSGNTDNCDKPTKQANLGPLGQFMSDGDPENTDNPVDIPPNTDNAGLAKKASESTPCRIVGIVETSETPQGAEPEAFTESSVSRGLDVPAFLPRVSPPEAEKPQQMVVGETATHDKASEVRLPHSQHKLEVPDLSRRERAFLTKYATGDSFTPADKDFDTLDSLQRKDYVENVSGSIWRHTAKGATYVQKIKGAD